MRTQLHSWLQDLPMADPIEREQAVLVQYFLLGAAFISVVGLFIVVFIGGGAYSLIAGPIAAALAAGSSLAGFRLVRRGRLSSAVLIVTISFTLALTLLLVGWGVTGGRNLLIGYVLPVMLAGLLLGRGGALLLVIISLVLVIGVAVLEVLNVPLVASSPPVGNELLRTLSAFVPIILVVGFFFDTFSASLRRALEAARRREQELQQARDSLEHLVAERTASLQQALQSVEEREARLHQTIEELQNSRQTIEQLSAPLIPVLPGVLVAPLVGALGGERAAQFTGNLLRTVETQSIRRVIFDVTGMPVLDTQVARILLQAAAAVQLLGARSLLVGVRPELAQTLVALGQDMGGLQTYQTLQEAIGALLPASNGALHPL